MYTDFKLGTKYMYVSCSIACLKKKLFICGGALLVTGYRPLLHRSNFLGRTLYLAKLYSRKARISVSTASINFAWSASVSFAALFLIRLSASFLLKASIMTEPIRSRYPFVNVIEQLKVWQMHHDKKMIVQNEKIVAIVRIATK